MAKLNLPDVGNFNAAGIFTLTNAFDRIEDAIENTLSRDGSTPNQMEADIDLNQNDLLNVDEITADTGRFDALYVGGVDIGSGLAPSFSDDANSIGTIAMAEAWDPEIAPAYVRIEGYYSPGDGGGALYHNVGASEPTHIGKFQSADGTWWEISERVANGLKRINPLAYGLEHNGDATETAEIANGICDGLTDAVVVWPPILVNLDDYIMSLGDNVRHEFMPGVEFRQFTWGYPVFTTADPDDESVRPDGAQFSGPARLVAYSDGDPVYYHHAFLGVSEAGPVVMDSSSLATEDNIFVFRNNVMLTETTDYTLSGIGTEELTITLVAPNAADEYLVVKVTNKWDRYSYPTPSIYGSAAGNRANESAAIWHGGGDNFLAEGFHVEGFVAIVSIKGDWTDDGPDVHSNDIVCQDITFNNCEFLLVQQCNRVRISRITGGVITESQTDGGMRNFYNPTGLTNPTFKDPHVCYVTNGGDSSTTKLILEDLEGENRYSSNYKVRNAVDVTIRAANMVDYLRAVDLDGVTNLTADFPLVKGAYQAFADSQRSAFGIGGVHDAYIRIGRLECDGDIIRAIRFETGRTPGVSGQRICQRVRVEVGTLFTAGTSARTNDWIINQGGLECFVKIGLLVQAGDDTVHVYRVRSSSDASIAYVPAIRGGIQIDRIRLDDARTLRVARLTDEDSVTPTNIFVGFDKSSLVGTATYSADTVIDSGTGTIIYSGTKRGTEVISAEGAFTLAALVNDWDIRHTAELLANRQVTLSTNDAQEGDYFYIIRTGVDAFNLNVGTGPLVQLITNSWCIVKFDGSAWYLAAYGVLP